MRKLRSDGGAKNETARATGKETQVFMSKNSRVVMLARMKLLFTQEDSGTQPHHQTASRTRATTQNED